MSEARKRLVAEVLALAAELRRHVEPGTASEDHTAMLYGDDGLPRAGGGFDLTDIKPALKEGWQWARN